MVIIQFGSGNNIEKDESEVPTVGAARTSRNLRASLGFDPSSVEGYINGAQVPDEMPLRAGDLLDFQTKANKKNS